MSDIRASGGDYATGTLWEDATDYDLVTATTTEIGIFYDDWPSGLDDTIECAGATVNATYYRKLTVASGHRHTGIPQSGFFIKGDSGGNLISKVHINEDYFQTEYLDVENTRTSGGTACGIRYTGQHQYAFSCIGKTNSSAAAGIISAGSSSTTSTWVIFDSCLMWGGTRGLGASDEARTRHIARNCVFANAAAYGCISGATNSAQYINCVAFNNATTDFYGTFDTTNGDYNASEDTSANVFPHYLTGVTSAAFNASGSNDFHLSGTGSALYHASALAGATYDHEGEAFDASTPSIGFDEYVTAGGGGSDLSITSTATETFVTNNSISSVLSASGNAAANWSAIETISTDYSMSASALAQFVGSTSIAADSSLSIQSQSLLTLNANLGISSDYQIPANGLASWIVNDEINSSFSINASVIWTGEGSTLISGQSDFNISSTGAVDFVSQVSISSDLDINTTAALDWLAASTGIAPTPSHIAPETSKGSAGWSSREWYNQKQKRQIKQQIEYDDSEIFAIIKQMMPQIMQFYGS